MRLSELATRLGAELRGNGAVEIHGIAGIEEAGEGQVTFVSNRKYAPLARTTRASAVLVEPGFADIAAATLRVADPYLAYARAVGMFYEAPRYAPGVHPTAVIAKSARLGAHAHVGPYAVVGEDVVVGEDAVIHAHVVLYPGVRVGARFVAHATRWCASIAGWATTWCCRTGR